jgi:adenosylcobinamide hydrolase
MSDALPIQGLHFSCDERALHLWSDEPLAVLSSAIVGAELEKTRHIVNVHVERGYDSRTPAADVSAFARELGLLEPFVGMMTAAGTERAHVAVERGSQVSVIALITVGLSHPTAAGVTGAFDRVVGTINTIVVVDARLTPAARVNAIITATEAKTLALVQAGIRTPDGHLASGTGTDAIVITSTERGARFEYAGPVAPLGAMVGGAVRRAIESALR